MQIKTKSGRLVTMPTPDEDAAITAAALADPDNPLWTDEQLANLKLKPMNTPKRKQTPEIETSSGEINRAFDSNGLIHE